MVAAPRSPNDDTVYTDAGDRLLRWALDTVPYARRSLDLLMTAEWRSWDLAQWQRTAVEQGFMHGSDGQAPSGRDAVARLGLLRETLDPATARRIIEDLLRGIKSASAKSLLSLVGHPAGGTQNAFLRVAGRVLGLESPRAGAVSDITNMVSRWARAAGLAPVQLQLLLNWLGGGVARGGVRAPGKPICGTQPRCEVCPILGFCRVGQSRQDGLTSPVREESHPAESALAEIEERRSVRIADLPPEDRPRERLIRGETLELTELLAILIKSGSTKHSALDLAREVLRRHPTLRALADASVEELAEVAGLGLTKAATVKAALELGCRVAAEVDAGGTRTGTPMAGGEAVYRYCVRRFDTVRAEQFLVLMLNTKLFVIREQLVAQGALDSVIVHPREVFAEAVRSRAHRIIVVHNHPSGDPTPSSADRRLTTRLVEAGEIVGIPLLDHLIIGAGSFFSFRDRGLLGGGWL